MPCSKARANYARIKLLPWIALLGIGGAYPILPCILFGVVVVWAAITYANPVSGPLGKTSLVASLLGVLGVCVIVTLPPLHAPPVVAIIRSTTTSKTPQEHQERLAHEKRIEVTPQAVGAINRAEDEIV